MEGAVPASLRRQGNGAERQSQRRSRRLGHRYPPSASREACEHGGPLPEAEPSLRAGVTWVFEQSVRGSGALRQGVPIG